MLGRILYGTLILAILVLLTYGLAVLNKKVINPKGALITNIAVTRLLGCLWFPILIFWTGLVITVFNIDVSHGINSLLITFIITSLSIGTIIWLITKRK